ncbi:MULTISPECIES: DUF1206 domain-containing protein [Pseudonocardia]|uniref:DUF1206 domain-containing protein n=2 Tax=Pseudonocardia TaxID=1847 RepID=A0A1Y2N7L2_PSEAH|nr:MULTISPECIES: DUF1206 domain-containing protein [Pseudonocardia]OSY43460.1 hypothetical protein BG845_00403 [Pseudonocardia autotrophica]TDN73545.1 uncharacterized protein DUF1206 [Pseudonocardia autotrophica]BBG04289.1 hypothetical protein Pdca_54980 [Pseudonocardia autotrophica]GEC25568.1 hypothetical protein PSA01_25970 [Pseudonocardia saturnea]
MVRTPDTADVARAGRGARDVAHSTPVRIAARIGIAANGVLHLMIGWLAVQVALGSGGQADQNGALGAIAAEPLGRAFLWVLVIGFAAVVLWRSVSAVWGFGYLGDRKKQLAKRVVSAGLAVVYLVLAVAAATTAIRGRASSGSGGEATAGLLGLPGGQIITALVGVGVVIGGGVMIWNGWTKRFMEDQDLAGADTRIRRLNARTGQVGFIAKGIAVGVLGMLLGVAALTFDPQRANGLDSALKALREQPYGVFLLIAVGLGIACYGIFCFLDARYHRVT